MIYPAGEKSDGNACSAPLSHNLEKLLIKALHTTKISQNEAIA